MSHTLEAIKEKTNKLDYLNVLGGGTFQNTRWKGGGAAAARAAHGNLLLPTPPHQHRPAHQL